MTGTVKKPISKREFFRDRRARAARGEELTDLENYNYTEADDPGSDSDSADIQPQQPRTTLTCDENFTERRAAHIARVAFQREQRKKNPPRRKKTVYKCKTCNIVCSGHYQLQQHFQSGPHKRKLQNIADAKRKLHCASCNLPFSSEHNYTKHIKGARHFRVVKAIAKSSK